MHGYKSIIAGVCGAAVMLGLAEAGATWIVALASGFAAMMAVGGVLRVAAPARQVCSRPTD